MDHSTVDRMIDSILEPFYGIQELLAGEERSISTSRLEHLMSMALERAEEISAGDK